MRIIDGKDQLEVKRHGGNYRAFVRSVALRRWGGAAPVIDWRPAGEAVGAMIQRGQWCVSCPDCPEVIISSAGEMFWCPGCGNARNGGRARPVVYPPARAEIERVLLARVNPATRNWVPGETVADLMAENDAHPGEVFGRNE